MQFHQPFLIRSGLSQAGLDAVARADSPLPASSLKGAMRAACTNALGVGSATVEAIFGREGRTAGTSGQGAWAWTDAGPAGAFVVQTRARNRIDAAFGVARAEALTLSEEWWQRPGHDVTFAVEQLNLLDPREMERHIVVLQVAAYATTALGSWRNRGMGTVTIRPINQVERLAERWQEVIA